MSTVMERIRKALHVIAEGVEARKPAVFGKSPSWTEPVPAVEDADLPSLLASIRTEAEHLNLKVHTCASLAECAAELAALARKRPAEWGTKKQIMCWNDSLLQSLNLATELEGSDIGVRFVPDQDAFSDEERAAFRRDVIDSYMGVTTADYLVADTASLVVLGGRGRGRSVSLVPSIHVAVVPMSRIVRSYRDVLRLCDTMPTLPGHMTFITGPSKTADIEATLVHGAHGPREMHLFLVP